MDLNSPETNWTRLGNKLCAIAKARMASNEGAYRRAPKGMIAKSSSRLVWIGKTFVWKYNRNSQCETERIVLSNLAGTVLKIKDDREYTFTFPRILAVGKCWQNGEEICEWILLERVHGVHAEDLSYHIMDRVSRITNIFDLFPNNILRKEDGSYSVVDCGVAEVSRR